jgi:hypothetical protein
MCLLQYIQYLDDLASGIVVGVNLYSCLDTLLVLVWFYAYVLGAGKAAKLKEQSHTKLLL